MSNGGPRGRTPLATRFLVYYALTYVLLIGLTGVFIERSVRSQLLDETVRDLEVVARIARDTLPVEESEYPQWVDSIFEASGFRLTLIDTDGVVAADSHSDPAVMENHATRPEFQDALDGDVGTATRTSVSTGFDQLYLALPPEDGLVVRTSVASRVISTELNEVRSSIILISVVAGLIGVAIVAYLARKMAQPITELTERARAMAEGDLGMEPRRSSVRELDQLGSALSAMGLELGSRVSEAETATGYLEVVLGALDEGTILIDRDGRLAYANPAAHALLGTVPDELSGLSPYQAQVVAREAKAAGTTVERIVEHGKPARQLRTIATPFVNDGRVLLVVIDVTAEERAANVRRDFVANASHELKTPVTTIIAASEALRIAVDRGDESATAFAAQIEASARQLDGLVSDLLDLSRLERETPELAPVRFDLLAQDEVERVREIAEAKNLNLRFDGPATVVVASHRDLAIAVRNLLDNAVRYTDEGGSIDVAIRSDGAMGIITIIDTGDGIPTRDLDRIFERFYRVDAGRGRATGGTGLGLSIVKHVVDSHRGEVEVDSELGVGSKFTLRIPMLATSSTVEAN